MTENLIKNFVKANVQKRNLISRNIFQREVRGALLKNRITVSLSVTSKITREINLRYDENIDFTKFL